MDSFAILELFLEKNLTLFFMCEHICHVNQIYMILSANVLFYIFYHGSTE